MRILVLTPTFLPVVGGAELLLLHVFRRLAARHDILLLTPHLAPELLAAHGNPEYDALVNFEVRRYADRVSLMRIPGHRASRGAIPPFSLSAVGAVVRAARQFRPEVLNVHYCMPTGLAAWAAQRLLGLPTVLSLTGRDVPGPGVPPLWGVWHRLVGRACAGRTYVTDYCRRAVYGPGAGAGAGVVIANGVDDAPPSPPGAVAALRAELGVPPDGTLVFALQRLDAVKRVDVLLRALPLVLREHPRTVLAVGGTGPEAGALRALARGLGVAGAVRFTGFLPAAAVPLHMDAADLFAFHSTYETFGIVLAEAMIRGRAVVSVADPAIAEVVDHGRTGLLTPVGDHEALARALGDLLADPAQRAAMGEAGRAKARALYGWDALAGQYEAALARAAGGGGP
ncbi:glycosyltransferase family 4 protein [Desulfocurvus vexinensis]|uniref:glycosyltransferase family 4 protein n=1 Tax=Desulfocurvus vexinensis TaxID=399548 RepID=UPI0004BC1CC1|nr:glycosyltransferase family 4 protein [Desulfocurvus vexinensis]